MSPKKNAYDEIRGMLNTIRSIKVPNNKLIREQTEVADEPSATDVQSKQYDNVEVINDVEIKIQSTDQEDIKLKDDEKAIISQLIDSFLQQVSQLGELDPGITINEEQIRLDGSIIDLDISFVYITGEESGFYINSDMLSVKSETLEMLDKLLKFSSVFNETMEPLLRTRRNS